MTGGPSLGGYKLVYYRDERSRAVKGTIYLETCTDIRPVRGREEREGEGEKGREEREGKECF